MIQSEMLPVRTSEQYSRIGAPMTQAEQLRNAQTLLTAGNIAVRDVAVARMKTRSSPSRLFEARYRSLDIAVSPFGD